MQQAVDNDDPTLLSAANPNEHAMSGKVVARAVPTEYIGHNGKPLYCPQARFTGE